ncbi:glycine-rich domain-containing protein [Pedobacter endophyticus]|uniref:DUF1399 domain-containing protein n=1 Tax=Pedobacter endophyticus TaxID=2789740 RepID=A0A7U3Q616_9SPHI|nr:DUF1399 domain-containing protein [Pedobacter endophyticus]QPH38300.1 DUF1399 domain-containing protein [Pedobacter endophyticus]
MNQELWRNILAFEFENPTEDYGFSTRLAKENFWTKAFTEQAILEYKKFMYLAATSNLMVSPSESVDIVWHQHLVFTQSYQDFCNTIGKKIHHIPSTHNKEDFEKFKQAKERTSTLYETDFGAQPKNIWGYNNIFESLNLEKADTKITSFIISGILVFIGLSVPIYFLLKPIYLDIDNLHFIVGYIILTIITLLALAVYSQTCFDNIVSQFDKSSFIFKLKPFELVYAKTQKLSEVLQGAVNELIESGVIQINADKNIELVESKVTLSKEQSQIVSVLNETGEISYFYLLSILIAKPVFSNTANCLEAFRKYFNKSKKFDSLYRKNFYVLMILLLLGSTRIATGILRDKPVAIILLATFAVSIFTIQYLQSLTKQISTYALPELYEKKILPTKQIEGNWQWSYFLLGSAVLTSSLTELMKSEIKKKSDYSSSCGSSCSSSCGGCGGD